MSHTLRLGCFSIAILLLAVPRVSLASQTLSFQEGDGGAYSATSATYIASYGPTTNFGNFDVMAVVGDGTRPVSEALVKFPDVFGTQSGQIPQGSTILSATLEVWTTDFLSGETFNVHQVLVQWTENTVTWSSFGSTPGGASGTDYAATPVASFQSNSDHITLDITPLVQTWSNLLITNQGVLIEGIGGGLGVELWSDDGSIQTVRPKLTVEFDSSVPVRSASWGELKAAF